MGRQEKRLQQRNFPRDRGGIGSDYRFAHPHATLIDSLHRLEAALTPGT
jgi:hypothetical protein